MRPFAGEVPDGAVVCDVRWTPVGGRDGLACAAGHLPGARFVDVDADLAGPATAAAGRHPLPEPGAFAAAMGRLGIGDGDLVIAYDGAGGTIAARLIWMLRVLGERAALLDADLTGRLTEQGPGAGWTERSFTARPWPAGALASIDEAQAAGATGAEPLIDGRPAERFRGDEPLSPLDPQPGHIPGARSLPVAENSGGDGRLLPEPVLRERYAAAGIVPGRSFIASCGSGVTACHALLVAEQLGVGCGRLYPGSWSQYAADPARPVATGG